MIQALITWFLLTGHPDAGLMKVYADSFKVPARIVWAIAEVESGHKADNQARGAHGEIGRFQIKPIWNASFKAECGSKAVSDYLTNLCKGPAIIRWCRNKTSSWSAAIACFNGSGKASTAYSLKVLSVIGRYQLQTPIQPDGVTYAKPARKVPPQSSPDPRRIPEREGD